MAVPLVLEQCYRFENFSIIGDAIRQSIGRISRESTTHTHTHKCVEQSARTVDKPTETNYGLLLIWKPLDTILTKFPLSLHSKQSVFAQHYRAVEHRVLFRLSPCLFNAARSSRICAVYRVRTFTCLHLSLFSREMSLTFSTAMQLIDIIWSLHRLSPFYRRFFRSHPHLEYKRGCRSVRVECSL